MPFFHNIESKLIQLISESKRSVRIAVTWFTNHDLFDAIVQKLESDESYHAELIVLNDRINNKTEGVDFQRFIDEGGDFYFSEVNAMVHHKFCIVDDELVVTGSYNWTYYAENRNRENIVLVSSESDVREFKAEFNRLTTEHSKVDSVSKSRVLQAGLNNNAILEQDYLYQLKTERFKGILKQASLLDAITKVNPKNGKAKEERARIVQKITKDEFRTLPFEIGIKYKNGYTGIIQAFSELPVTVTKTARSIKENQTNLRTTVQILDSRLRTILQFTTYGIQPKKMGTTVVEHQLDVDEQGILTVTCRELDGFGKHVTRRINLKQFIS